MKGPQAIVIFYNGDDMSTEAANAINATMMDSLNASNVAIASFKGEELAQLAIDKAQQQFAEAVTEQYSPKIKIKVKEIHPLEEALKYVASRYDVSSDIPAIDMAFGYMNDDRTRIAFKEIAKRTDTTLFATEFAQKHNLSKNFVKYVRKIVEKM